MSEFDIKPIDEAIVAAATARSTAQDERDRRYFEGVIDGVQAVRLHLTGEHLFIGEHERNEAMKSVSLICQSGDAPYNAGETASFSPDQAERRLNTGKWKRTADVEKEKAEAAAGGGGRAAKGDGKVQAAPGARALAERGGIDIANVTGTGREGWVKIADVQAYADANGIVIPDAVDDDNIETGGGADASDEDAGDTGEADGGVEDEDDPDAPDGNDGDAGDGVADDEHPAGDDVGDAEKSNDDEDSTNVI